MILLAELLSLPIWICKLSSETKQKRPAEEFILQLPLQFISFGCKTSNKYNVLKCGGLLTE